jgi:hypothetical protein
VKTIGQRHKVSGRSVLRGTGSLVLLGSEAIGGFPAVHAQTPKVLLPRHRGEPVGRYRQEG